MKTFAKIIHIEVFTTKLKSHGMKIKNIEQVELLKRLFIRINSLEWYRFNEKTKNYTPVTGTTLKIVENLYEIQIAEDFKNDKYA